MLYVRELLERLATGAISNLSLSEGVDQYGNQTIKDEQVPKVLRAANAGLVELATRFNLREKELVLRTIPGVTVYPLRKQHCMSHQGLHPCFILDELKPFDGDLIKVLGVVGPDQKPRPLNDHGHPLSVFTPSPDTLQILENCAIPLIFSVAYQAMLTPLEVKGAGVLEQVVQIPAFFQGALESYIAHKIFSGMVGAEYLTKSQEQLSLFEAACITAQSYDLTSSSQPTSHHKLEERGFI